MSVRHQRALTFVAGFVTGTALTVLALVARENDPNRISEELFAEEVAEFVAQQGGQR